MSKLSQLWCSVRISIITVSYHSPHILHYMPLIVEISFSSTANISPVDLSIPVLILSSSLITDVTGYVAVDTTNSLIVVSFRGSGSVRNYLTDLNFHNIDASELCDGCEAFDGFYTSWKEARTGVLSSVKSAAAANPSFQIVCVGHSLGGAVAVFAATELRNSNYSVSLYTFGQPRIGPKKVSDYITDQGDNYRITHKKDPVPKLPPLLLGYVHVSPEYYLSGANDEEVTIDGVDGPLEGSVNFMGNSGSLAIDFAAHGWPDVFEFRKRDVFRVPLRV
ncbi:hypothetical protein SLS58_002236 [Diplodia intermedia]|uniref:Fungal lipase-type domain-containing protein n=1 Tax=Diplodia intermedia TaxID=856260 RepID=A0ABR3TZZ0_9PEZI